MKFLKVLLLSFSLFLLPNVVKADGAAPSFTEYSVRIKNPEGAYSYKFENSQLVIDKNCHYDYDEIIDNIMYEQSFGGELYVMDTENTVCGGYIKFSDVEVYGNINYEDFKLSKPEKLYVFKEGAYLYKGPSKVYGKVEGDVMLPVGTTIEYEYEDGMFAYVTYNNVSGWVYIYQMLSGGDIGGPYEEGSSLANINSGEIISIEDGAKIYKDVLDSEVLITVPKWEKLKYKYTYNYSYATKYYVEYNGVKGWIEDAASICDDWNLFTHLNTLKLCKTRQDYDCSDVVMTLPQNKIIPIKYYVYDYDNWYYIEYNGKSGWVYEEAHESLDIDEKYFNNGYILKTNAKIYTDIYGYETQLEIEAGDVNADFYVYDNMDYNSEYVWLHISEGKNRGWIKVNKNSVKYKSREDNNNNNNDNNSNQQNNVKTDNENVTYIPFKDVLIYSIFGAIGLSITIIVIIKLVNKKKEDKKDTENKQ